MKIYERQNYLYIILGKETIKEEKIKEREREMLSNKKKINLRNNFVTFGAIFALQ